MHRNPKREQASCEGVRGQDQRRRHGLRPSGISTACVPGVGGGGGVRGGRAGAALDPSGAFVCSVAIALANADDSACNSILALPLGQNLKEEANQRDAVNTRAAPDLGLRAHVFNVFAPFPAQEHHCQTAWAFVGPAAEQGMCPLGHSILQCRARESHCKIAGSPR